MQKIIIFSSLCLALSPARAQTNQQTVPTSPPQREAKVPANTVITVAGKVTLPNGTGAGKAHLYVRWKSSVGQMQFHRFLADAAGAFRFTTDLTLAPAGWNLGITASMPGSGFAWRALDASSADIEKLDLKLTPLHTLHGRLLLTDGRPATHVPLKCASLFSLNHTPVLPDEEVASLSRTTTDLAGRFTLGNVPGDCAVSLSSGAGLALTDASSAPFPVMEYGPTNLGLLVATGCGALTVHIVNAETGKAMSGAPLLLRRQHAVDQLLENLAFQPSRSERQCTADAQGTATLSGLLPGDYIVNVLGQTRTVKVRPGSKSSRLEMSVRSGPLKGRILDANGAPVAKCPVTVRFPFDPVVQSIALANGPMEGFQILNQDQNISANNVVTDADGTFQIPNFAWGSPLVMVRAVQGNALAEWTGLPSTAGKELTLKMRGDALITVTGRLIDPERHIIKQATCETLHWLPTARRTWFATAQPVKVDDQGRFRVSGLERGESFSIITPQSARLQTESMLPDVVRISTGIEWKLREGEALQRVLSVRDFESPRFVTRRDVDEQDLGDTMVHPNQSPEENQQIYGVSTPDVLAQIPGFLEAPSADSVRQAQRALARYQKAAADGDADTLFRLTSSASFGWSPHREEFLLHGWLRPQRFSASASVSRALPLVSRFGAASLVSLNSNGAAGAAIDLDATERDLQKHPDWVFLARNEGGQTALTGILRKESGQWRVVAFPDIPDLRIAATVLQNAGEQNGDFDRMLPAPDPRDLEAAVLTGKQYLRTWASKDMPALFASSTLMPAIAGSTAGNFNAALLRRPDEGVCPLDRDEKVDPRPIAGLSFWDQAHLIRLVQSRDGVGVTESRAAVSLRQAAPLEIWTTLEYANGVGKKFLMLLAKNETGWHVFEPALPL